MDLRIIKINAKATCGDSFILKKITAAYNYADGSRVGDPVGYNYLVALPDRMLEDLKVRVDGPRLIDELKKPLAVKFENLQLEVKWTKTLGYYVAATASAISLATSA